MKSSRTKKSIKTRRADPSRVKKRRDISMPAVPLYSDSDYESLLENSRDVIYRFDIVKRTYSYVSPSSFEVLGIKPAVFLKKKYGVLTPLLHKDEKEFLKSHLRKIFKAKGKGRKSFYVEYRVKMPGDDYIWIADNHTIVYGPNGKPESVIGNITDITFRKNTQEELLRSFELQKGYLNLLSSVQDALPAHIAMLDNRGNIVTVNESWKNFADGNALLLNNYGVGVNYLEVCENAKGEYCNEAKEAAEGLRKVLTGRLKEFQLDYPCHSPIEQRWFRMVCTPISRVNNKGAVVMHINTTERKLAEVALKESEAQYRQLFIEDLTGNYIADMNGRVLLCNPAFAQMFGFGKPEDVWNSKKFNVFSEKKDLAKQINQLKRGKKIPLHERVVTSINGIKKTVLENLAGRYDSDGTLMSIHGYMLDITGMKTAEEALKLSEEQYRVLFYENPLPMWIFDFETLRFIAVNDSAIKHYGYSRKEFLCMTLYDIRPESEKTVYRKYREKIIRQKRQKTAADAGTWKHRKKNGEIIDVEITRRPVEFQGKEAILILANDITERVRSEEILKKRNNEVNLLYMAGKEFSSSLDTEKIYDSVYEIVSEIMPCDSLVISSYEAKTKHIKCLALWQNKIKIKVSGFPELKYDNKGQGTQSKVIKSGEPLIVNDYDKMVANSSRVYYMKADGKPAAGGKVPKIERSAILIPMKLRGKVIGIIQVRSYMESAYTKEDLRILEALTNQLNAAIANALLYKQAQHEIEEREKTEKELKKKTEELSFLYMAERALSSSLHKEKIYDKLYSNLRKMIPCESMVISSYSDKDNLMRCESAWIENTKHNAADFPPLVHGKGGEGTQSEVIRTGKAFIRNDFDTVINKNSNRYLFDEKGNVINPKTEKNRVDPEQEMIKSAMFVPMKLNKKVIGVISVFSFARNAFTENDLRLLETLSGQVSASTVNATLYRQAQDEIKVRKHAEEKLFKRTKEITLLYRAYKEFTSTLEPSEIYDKTYRILRKIIPCDAMSVVTKENKTSTMKFVSVWQEGKRIDISDLPIMKIKPKGKGGILTNLIHNKKAEIHNDYLNSIKNNQGIITVHTDREPGEDHKNEDNSKESRSALFVPLKIRNEVFGVLSVFSFEKNAYSNEDLSLLEAITTQLSATTFNALLYQSAQNEIKERKLAEAKLLKRTREISLLYEAYQELTSTLKPSAIYDKTYRILKKIMPCDAMSILNIDLARSTMKFVSVWQSGKKHKTEDIPEMKVKHSGEGGILTNLINNGYPEIHNDYYHDVKHNPGKISLDNEGNLSEEVTTDGVKDITRSAILVPMKIQSKVFGVLSVYSYKKDAYTKEDLNLLEALTAQLSAATVNAKLYEQAQNEIAEKEKAEEALNSKTREIGFLYEAQKELSASLDMTIVYDRINKLVSDKMSCDSMIISSFNKERSEIKLLSVWGDGVKADLVEAVPIPLAPKGYGIQSEVIRSGESKLILDYENQFLKSITKITYTDNKPLEKAKGLYSSALLVPMKIDGEVIGVIQVLSYKKSAYDESDLRLLESLTGPITAATINASLYHQAQTEIIERSRKEKELGVIKKNLEEAQRIAHVGSWFYDLKSNSIIHSAEINRILGAGSGESTLPIEEAMNHVHDEDRAVAVEKIGRALKERSSYANEDRITRPDGETRFVKIVGEPIFDEAGELSGLQGTMQDITDIKKINEELKKSLTEKELMLKEIHHRVKNNLQIVSSLLRLQSDKITDKAAIEYLKHSEQRVKSMALIHQQLYKTKDLARINFGDYTKDLCTYLFFSYGVSRSRVDFIIDVKNIFFSIDTALPCGLIINELVTNSIKHGFPGDMRGTVTIGLHKDETGKNHLLIKDDGKGSDKLDFENTSTLGMELVRTLTDQLEGEISVNTNNGTEININFFDLS